MEDLLFLAHRIPYPPNKGDKIRSFNLLRYLAGRFRIHLGAFVDDPHDERYIAGVKAYCADACLLPLSPRRARAASLSGLLRAEPLSLPYFRDRRLQRWVDARLASGVGRVLVFSSAMAQYVADRLARLRSVVDFVDVDSDKWRQYASKKRWPASWIYGRESRRLLDYERRVAAAAGASVFVSEQEADLFRRLAPESAGRVLAVENGVDIDYFSPERSYDNPYPAGTRAVVFTGAMDYWANVDAVCWFAAEVLPGLRRDMPDCRFYIVGSRPTAPVSALARSPGIEVMGAVPDIRPFLAHAALSVAPLRIARGVQNKVLEAMAMGCRVLASREAAEGITAVPERDLVVAGDAADMAGRALRLLRHPDAALGQSARRYVVQAYRWADKLERFCELLQSGPAASAA